MVLAEILSYLIQNPSSLLILIVIVTFKGEIKRKFTGRPSLVSNTITIFIASASKWSIISPEVQLYSIIGLFVCLVAFITYMTNTRLPDGFYQFSWVCYNSIFALVFPFIFWV